MYESFFQLRERPFPYTPRSDLYVPAAPIEQAYHTLARCIERAEGPGLLIGGPGTGKSLVCQLLADGFRERFHVALLNSAQLCTRRSLLQHLLFELNLPCRGLDEGELRLSLLEFLQRDHPDRHGVLIVVDEAHTLPLRLFEDLRMITNIAHQGQPRVRLVLAGGHALEEHFAHPKLECFNQRLAARCYLQPLTYDETCGYVHSQVAKAGGAPGTLIADDAWQPIYHATGGVPRLINQVCDHALWLAYVARQTTIDARVIEEAWADLQQLPTPWQARPAAAEESVVEFGSLTEPDAEPALVPSQSQQDASPAVTGTSVPDTLDLAARLDDLQGQLSELDALDGHESSTAETRDGRATRVGIEKEAAACVDPFGERFDQEEVVVDHYASLQAAAGQLGNAAAKLQRREFTSAIDNIFEPARAPAPAEPPVPAEPPAPEVAPKPHEPDPQPPICQTQEPETQESREQAAEDEACLSWAGPQLDVRRVEVIRTPPPDDNDMILVVDQLGQIPLRSASGISHRKEYGQLFSRLRQS